MSDEKPKRIEPYPQEDDRSLPYHVARTALDAGASLVPGAGYAIGELVRHFIGEPLEKRREEWFASLGEGVIELQGRLEGFDPASLSGNEEFISAVYETTQHAMKTHHAEKREALRNAVLNVARGYSLDEVERGAFMSVIDRFSPFHLTVLRLLADPTSHAGYMRAVHNAVMGSRETYISRALHGQANDGALGRVLDDLRREGLTDGSERGGVSGTALIASATTPSGNRFLRFVSSPTE
ncbi:hypothetical protein [Methylobacterium sp. ARG-1]|uniref:hypothetical protein n=1 Tax=Methylobacterium sp. ARG-1 TaxID=1692501 RepID=UPI000B30425A|nr:hypothetical protein [Methylobacterium sp. ARG-1]